MGSLTTRAAPTFPREQRDSPFSNDECVGRCTSLPGRYVAVPVSITRTFALGFKTCKERNRPAAAMVSQREVRIRLKRTSRTFRVRRNQMPWTTKSAAKRCSFSLPTQWNCPAIVCTERSAESLKSASRTGGSKAVPIFGPIDPGRRFSFEGSVENDVFAGSCRTMGCGPHLGIENHRLPSLAVNSEGTSVIYCVRKGSGTSRGCTRRSRSAEGI